MIVPQAVKEPPNYPHPHMTIRHALITVRAAREMNRFSPDARRTPEWGTLGSFAIGCKS